MGEAMIAPGAVLARRTIGDVRVRLALVTTDIVSWYEVAVYCRGVGVVHHTRSTCSDEAAHDYCVACRAAERVRASP